MKKTALHLESIIDQYLPALKKIPEAAYFYKPAPSKWSKQEIMGHLIDSAQSNIRRFVIAQYEQEPFIVYNQDKWVSIVGYQQWKVPAILDLWYLLNKQVCAILRNTPAEAYQRTARSHEVHTIEWLAEDYVKHLLHHLHVVLDLEPVAYP
jgi:hypothetical protein